MSADRLTTLPCVVLGGGITALGVVRSLGRSGERPIIVSPPGDLAARSRFVERHIADVPEAADPFALEQALVERGYGEAVLFPCSDTWAQAVARMSEEARKRYRASIASADILDVLVDKTLFCAAAERLGVPHPATRRIDSIAEIRPEEYDGYFLKPSNSQKFNAKHSDKAVTFEDEEGASEGLRLMGSAGVTTLLQEYIPGPPTCHYFVDGYLDRAGTVRAVFVRRRTRMFPVRYGNSTHMVTVAPTEAEQAVTDVVAFLRALGFHGTFSAEFKRDPRDGVFKLLEVNGRPWWYIGFAADCGVDIAQLSLREAIGLEVETIDGYREGVRCVLLHLDVRAAAYERRERGLTVGAWLRSVIGARSTVFAWSDPRPGVSLFWTMTISKVRRSVAARTRRSRDRGV